VRSHWSLLSLRNRMMFSATLRSGPTLITDPKRVTNVVEWHWIGARG
jgi:hypothetical protein